MKNKLFVAFMVLALIACAIQARLDKGNLREGRQTPDLIVANGDSTINLRDLYGKYVLVDFWSSADAGSRIKSNEYNRLAASAGDNLRHISVNFDRSEGLFRAIVSRDNLDPSSQYFVEGADAGKIRRDFNLSDGYKSYLISPNGKIIAINPTPEQLMKWQQPS